MFSLVPFLSYVFVASFTPGPNNIMAMSNANLYGFRKTLKFNLGVSAGFALIMLLCSYLNLFLYSMIPRIKLAMGIVGAFYMVYLAYKIVMSKPHGEEGKREKLYSFFSGLVLQFVNPKAILYGVTVTANFIIPYYKTTIQFLLFSMLLAFIAFISTSAWAVFGALFQKFLSKYEKPFNIMMGILLIYCAVSIFL